jgi:DNA-binding transcriptional regulator YhcF (GntR family)
MHKELLNDQPIYLQVKVAVEEDILTGAIKADERIPSNSQLVERYGINPVTVLKATDLLVAEGTVYKKRGVGMFASTGAQAALQQRYREQFVPHYIEPLIQRAHQLGINATELQDMVLQAYEGEDNERR